MAYNISLTIHTAKDLNFNGADRFNIFCLGYEVNDFLHRSFYLPAPPTVSHRPTWCQWIGRVKVVTSQFGMISLNTMRPDQNGHHGEDAILKYIFC